MSKKQDCCKRLSCKGKDMEPIQSWVTLAAAFMCNLQIAIPESTFSIIYDPLVEKFDTTRAEVGWVFSIMLATSCISGLLMRPIIMMYGVRVMAFGSCCVFALGMSVTCLAPNLAVFYVCYGFIGGIGFGGMFLASHTAVQVSFSYNRGLATGISTLGFTSGTIIGPVLIDIFFQYYGLNGALLLMGAIFVQSIVFTLFLNPPNSLQGESKQSAGDQSCGHAIDEREAKKEVDIDGDFNIEEQHDPNVNPDMLLQESSNVLEENDSTQNKGTFDVEWSNDQHHPDGCPQENHNLLKETSRVLKENDNFQNKSDSDVTGSNDDIQNPAQFQDEVKKASAEAKDKPSHNSKKDIFKNMTDFSIMKDPCFILMMVYYFFMILMRFAMLSQCVGAAIHSGIPPSKAAYLVTIMGFVNLVVRIVSAILLNMRWANCLLYSSLGILVFGASSILAIFAQSYSAWVMVMVAVGFCEGTANTAMPMVVVYIATLEKFIQAFIILRLGNLPACLISSPLAGWLYDITGHYTATFLLVTGCAAIAVSTGCILYVLKRRRYQTEKKLSLRSPEPTHSNSEPTHSNSELTHSNYMLERNSSLNDCGIISTNN